MSKISNLHRIAFVMAVSFYITLVVVRKGEAQGIVENYTFNIIAKKGETIEITTMYSINRKSCIADNIPPKPILFGKLNFGSIKYRTGKTVPRQCPSIMINANFADYTASTVAGVEKFKIHWKSTKGYIYVRNYKIVVK